MTNEERDALIAQGWTPPVPVDPDTLADPDTFEASAIIVNQNIYENVAALVLDAIRRGRALAAAEAKPGLVWVKHEQSNTSPVPGSMVTVMFHKGHYETGPSFMFDWWRVDYYAIITPPEDK